MKEKPVNRPRMPPQFAKKSARPISSFLSAGMNCGSLKNMVNRLKYTLKENEIRFLYRIFKFKKICMLISKQSCLLVLLVQ